MPESGDVVTVDFIGATGINQCTLVASSSCGAQPALGKVRA